MTEYPASSEGEKSQSLSSWYVLLLVTQDPTVCPASKVPLYLKHGNGATAPHQPSASKRIKQEIALWRTKTVSTARTQGRTFKLLIWRKTRLQSISEKTPKDFCKGTGSSCLNFTRRNEKWFPTLYWKTRKRVSQKGYWRKRLISRGRNLSYVWLYKLAQTFQRKLCKYL